MISTGCYKSPSAAHDDRGTYRAYLRLGEVFAASGNLQGAREYEERAYDLAKRNAERSPDDQEWQRDLSVSYQKIGDLLKTQGNLPEARHQRAPGNIRPRQRRLAARPVGVVPEDRRPA
jgi:tetratricopeptide (TPR) repeat protein